MRLLEKGFEEFAFSLRRFSLAFDHDLIEDRIVDLVIAAESLFWGDLNVPDRRELRSASRSEVPTDSAMSTG